MFPAHSTAYGWMLLLGIAASLFFWSRMARRDERLIIIYLAALAGAFVGAKLVYFASEGWLYWKSPQRWAEWLAGKSIIGGLLGGYIAVEFAKSRLGYTSATGDLFAIVVPLGLMFGRVGCLLQGCCLGRACQPSWYTMNDAAGTARWPAALVELIFNGVMLCVALILRRRGLLAGQRFHLYLICYGVFRFGHEFLRATPRMAGVFTGYHLFALALAAFGAVAFWRRAQQDSSAVGATYL